MHTLAGVQCGGQTGGKHWSDQFFLWPTANSQFHEVIWKVSIQDMKLKKNRKETHTKMHAKYEFKKSFFSH